MDLWVVVKVNVYGYGIIEVVRIVKEVGVKGFCVVILDEVLVFREVGF